jgi:hypothetical protein
MHDKIAVVILTDRNDLDARPHFLCFLRM